MKKYFLTLLVLVFSIASVFSDETSDVLSDKSNEMFHSKKIDNSFMWIYEYIAIDPSDDMYAAYHSARRTTSEGYVQALRYRRNIEFFNAGLDRFNLTQNINLMPYYPFVYMPYGGFSLNHGFELGFLTRFDSINNSELSLTIASHFSQDEQLQHFMGVEYPALLNHRMRIFGGSTIFTTAPQYQSLKYNNDESSFLLKAFNKIWSMVKVTFNDVSYLGMEHFIGVDYRIPLIEVNSVSQFKLAYRHVYNRVFGGKELSVNQNNLYFVFRQQFIWDKVTQTGSVPVGNVLKATFDFFIPTQIGDFAKDFRFKFSFEDKYSKKIYREFYLAAKIFGCVNYNISDNFCGEPFIRGYKGNELVGWAALLANLEFNVPLINADIKSTVSERTFKTSAKMILYFDIFADFGVVFDNPDYVVDYDWYRPFVGEVENSFDRNKMIWLGVGNNNYFWPACSLGAGLKLVPKFLHFIFRLDVGFNMIKSIVYQDASKAFDISLSFSNAF